MTPRKMNKVLKISLAALAVLVAVGIYFADKQLQSVAGEISRLRAEIEITNQNLDNYELTKTKIDELSYVKDLADEILPQTEEQSIIVAELSEFAKRSNLSTGSIEFTDESSSSAGSSAATTKKAPAGVEVVSVVFSVSDEASYQDVLEFLRYIEGNRRKMQVTRVSLTPGSGGQKIADLTVSLNLFVKKKAD